MSFDYFSKSRVQYILTKLKLILDGKAVPSDIKNGTLTIQKNGTNVQTFTANQSSNATANITVPTKTSDLTNDSGYITNAGVTGVKGNSETNYRTGNVNITASNIGLGNVGNFKAVSTVASQGLTDTEKSNARANIGAGTSNFSGSYNDLSNKPTIPTVNNGTLTIQKNGTNVQTFTANQSGNATANITVPTKTSDLTNDSGFISYKAVSTVASQGLTDTEKSNARANIGAGTSSFSGSYNDLSNKPTIPTVNNGTLTIQKNGTNVQTFTANQSGNATANITVPTKVSELTNDSGFTTNTGTITGIKMNGASKGTSGVVDLGTVITAHQDISGKANTADLGDGAYKNSGVYYGTCSTAAATKDKAVSVSADQKFTLKVGAVVHVKFTNSNSYSATADNKITLNVNSTGAKNIYYGTGYPTGTNTTAFGAANYIMSYMYNGTDWVWVGFSGENNTTYSVMSTSEGTTGTATTARTMSAANLKAIIDARGYTSNTGTVTSVATGVGLTGGTITGSGTIKAKLKSETASTLDSTAMGSTASRQYAVGVDKSGYLSVNIPWTDTDTKNTAGSTDSSSKLFLIGATSQAANPQTYSHDTAYVGTDGCLYSGGTKVLTAHQDISGKADKSATVSTVAWDSTNKKITKTINGTTSDVVTAATILGNLTKAQVTTALGYTPPTSDTNTHRPIQVNGTEILGNNTTALNLKAGSNVSVTNSSGTVTIAATDTNTWRGIQDNLTSSTNTTESLSAKQGYLLANGSARDSTKLPLAGGTMTGRITSAKPNTLLITGSGTAASDKGSGVSPRYFPAKWTFNTGVAPADGDVITIKIPVAGHDYGVFVSINNGTNYHPVRFGYGTSRLTTHFGNGQYITLVYTPNATVNSIYAAAGADARSNITGCWTVVNTYDTNTVPSAICTTAAGTAAKAASCSNYALLANSYIQVIIANTNTVAGAITLNINGTGAKPIYLNGTATSSSNYALTAGSYLVYYNGTNYYFRKDGKITTAGLVNTSNSDYALTDAKVTQTATDSTDANYEILFSSTADNTTRTEGARKSSKLLFNSSTGIIYSYLNGLGEIKHVIINNSIDTNSSPYVTENTWTGLEIRDKNNKMIAGVQSTNDVSTTNSAALVAANYKSNGEVVYNNLVISVDKDGTKRYRLDDPKAFVTALGASSFTSWTLFSSSYITNCIMAATILGNKILFIESLVINFNITTPTNTDLIKFSGINMLNTNEHSYMILKTGTGTYIGQIQFYNSGSDIYVKSRTQLTNGWSFVGGSIVIMLK